MFVKSFINEKKTFKDKYFKQKTIIDNSEIEFKNCIFKNNNIITITQSKVKFVDCSFYKNNNNIINAVNSKLELIKCTINKNSSNYEPLILLKKSYVIFNNTSIYNNRFNNEDYLNPSYGSILKLDNSECYFKNNSLIKYNYNYGLWNLGLFYSHNSKIYFLDNTLILSNYVSKSLFNFHNSIIFIKNNSIIENNFSQYLGVFNLNNCNTIIQDNSKFINNKLNSSSVITISGFNSNLIIQDNVLFDKNILNSYIHKYHITAPCIYINTFSENIDVLIKDNVQFTNNSNKNGLSGAVYFGSNFKTNFTDNFFYINDNVLFKNNISSLNNDIYTNYNLIIQKNVIFYKCIVNNINNITLKSIIENKNKIIIDKNNDIKKKNNNNEKIINIEFIND